MVKQHLALMQFCTSSMSTMLAITKHGVCVGIIAPCLVNFIMVDMEEVQKNKDLNFLFCYSRQITHFLAHE